MKIRITYTVELTPDMVPIMLEYADIGGFGGTDREKLKRLYERKGMNAEMDALDWDAEKKRREGNAEEQE